MNKNKLKWSIATQGAIIVFAILTIGWISLNLFEYFSFESWNHINAGLLGVAMLMMGSLFIPLMIRELRDTIWIYRKYR
jgi:hypothetical protein